MNKTILPIAIIACAAESVPLHAQNLLTNGGLDHPTNEGSATPAGWAQVPQSFTGSSLPVGSTVDILDTVDQTATSGILGTPHSGNTFVSGLHATIFGFTLREGIQQEVSLSAGTEYELSFFQAIIKQSNALDSTGSWIVYLDDDVLFDAADVFSGEAFDSLNTPWEERTHTFTAQNDGTQTLRFIANDRDGTLDVRMGIDTISLTQVPEPSSISLLALGSAALLARRKR